MLTKGVDNITGTAGNDTFNANYDAEGAAAHTLGGLDVLNGGAGNDTLAITSASGAAFTLAAATISNIETMTIRGDNAVTAVVSGANVTGLNTLNLTQAAGAVALTAGATTDVNVSGAVDSITVKGGKDVAVTDATAAKAITVGDNTVAGGDAAGKITITDTNNTGANAISAFGGTDVTITTTADKADSGAITVGHATNGQASGAVVVTQNSTSNGTAMTAGDITVIGGSTVNITANMTNTAVKGGGATDITAGAIAVTAGNTTTAVTVTQNATATDFANDAAALVKETSVVTFKAIKSGEALTINGLTFTAAKDLTADEAAAAFANLTAADTQTSGGKVANGIYTGTFNTAVWTSGAASGATVTFTATDDNETDLTFTGTAATNDAGARIPTQVKTAGALAGASTAVDVTADYGAVTINDNATAASLTTITVNGYDASSAIGGTNATTALSSLTLANAKGTADIVIADTAATLALNVNGGMGTSTDGTEAVVTFTAAPTTLNVTATGNNYIDLTADATETLSVAGTGLLDIADIDLLALKTVTVTGSASLTLAAATSNTVTSIDTSGTTGTVTATIDADNATYTGGAGVDNVTLSTTTVDKAVNLGAGNDTLTLASGTTSLTSEMIGGDGTDTLVMVAADAVTASATTTFETKITGFEKLSLGAVANGSTSTVDLSNMDDINYVISANATGTGVTESSAVTFQSLTLGQSVTVAGLTLTADEAMTANEVAAAFASIAANGTTGTTPGFKGVFSGTLTGFASGAASTATVTFTSSTTLSNVTDITSSSAALAAGTEVIASDTPDVTESAVVTFVGLAEGESITVGGLTLTLNDDGDADTVTITAADVAAAFASLTAGATSGNAPTLTGNNTDPSVNEPEVSWSGTLTGFNSGAASGTTVTFTGSTPDVSLADIVVSDTAAGGDVSATVTDGYASETVTFQDLAIGQTVTVGGLTYTALTARTAAQVAAAFSDIAAGGTGTSDANGSFSGSLSTAWVAQTASGSNVEFRTLDAAAGYSVTETNLTQSVNTAGSAPTALTVVTTQGAAASGAAALTLTKMANNGTLELTAAGDGATVTMTDATGTADTFNIVTKVNASDLNFGTVAVAGVETINITATDTSPVDANGNATISKATMTLSDAAAKSVVITGNSDLDLTAAGTSLTSVDGSAMTGKLTFTTAVDNAVIKGGSAADTLTANADDVTLTGNGGNDTLTVNAGADRAILTGGDGADKFVIAGASSTSSTYSTITALNTGDVIQFTGATAFAVTKVTLSAGATETTQALMDLAVNNLAANGMGWFQTGGNTFIVMDAGADSTAGFVNGQDIVVMITGLVDLSTASYNSGSNTLEIA